MGYASKQGPLHTLDIFIDQSDEIDPTQVEDVLDKIDFAGTIDPFPVGSRIRIREIRATYDTLSHHIYFTREKFYEEMSRWEKIDVDFWGKKKVFRDTFYQDIRDTLEVLLRKKCGLDYSPIVRGIGIEWEEEKYADEKVLWVISDLLEYSGSKDKGGFAEHPPGNLIPFDSSHIVNHGGGFHMKDEIVVHQIRRCACAWGTVQGSAQYDEFWKTYFAVLTGDSGNYSVWENKKVTSTSYCGNTGSGTCVNRCVTQESPSSEL